MPDDDRHQCRCDHTDARHIQGIDREVFELKPFAVLLFELFDLIRSQQIRVEAPRISVDDVLVDRPCELRRDVELLCQVRGLLFLLRILHRRFRWFLCRSYRTTFAAFFLQLFFRRVDCC